MVKNDGSWQWCVVVSAVSFTCCVMFAYFTSSVKILATMLLSAWRWHSLFNLTTFCRTVDTLCKCILDWIGIGFYRIILFRSLTSLLYSNKLCELESDLWFQRCWRFGNHWRLSLNPIWNLIKAHWLLFEPVILSKFLDTLWGLFSSFSLRLAAVLWVGHICISSQWLLSLYLVGAACVQWKIGGGLLRT